MNEGRIVQIIGPVLDVEFPPDSVPKILDACEIERKDDESKLVIETALHLGENVVRCVAMAKGRRENAGANPRVCPE